jgi:hypothetical protein
MQCPYKVLKSNYTARHGREYSQSAMQLSASLRVRVALNPNHRIFIAALFA